MFSISSGLILDSGLPVSGLLPEANKLPPAAPPAACSMGTPLITYKGALLPANDLLPLIIILLELPGPVVPSVILTPAALPCKEFTKFAVLFFVNSVVGTL